MPPQRPQQRHELVEWYHSIPPITRAILTLSIATTATTTFGLYRFNSLIYYWPAISHKFQLWRLITCFFCNKLNIGFAFNLFFMYRNSVSLETGVFSGQPADYVFYHLFTGLLQLVAASFFDIFMLSDGLLLSVAYLWAQHNRDTPVSFMFGLNFKALYLPWVMIGYDFLMSGGIPKAGIVGILSSHIYYYLTTIYPRQGGRRYLQTPQFLRTLLPGSRGNFNSGNATTPQRQANMFGRHSWGSGQRLGN